MTASKIGKYIPDWIWWTLIAFFGIWVLLGVFLAVDALDFFAGAQRTRGEVVELNTDPVNSTQVFLVGKPNGKLGY